MGKIWNAQSNLYNPDVVSLANTVGATVQSHLEQARGISFSYDDPFGQVRSQLWIH